MSSQSAPAARRTLPEDSFNPDPIIPAAFDGDIFRTTISHIARTFPGTVPVIIGIAQNDLGHFVIDDGSVPSIPRAINDELALKTDWAKSLWTREPGQVHDQSDTPDQRGRNDQPLVSALRSHRPAIDRYCSVVCGNSDGFRIIIQVHYPAAREDRYRRPLHEALPLIAARLEIATRIVQTSERLQDAESLSTSLLDMLPYPVFLCRLDRHVAHANLRARDLISKGAPLTVSPDGILRLSGPEADEGLQDIFDDQNSHMRQRISTLPLDSRALCPRELLTVVRLEGSERLSTLRELGTGPRVAVIYENLDAAPVLDKHVLWRLFNLTNKETDLALALLAGRSISDLAVQRRISKETLRNQLAAVMRKTDTGRQQELVALLTRMATLHGTA